MSDVATHGRVQDKVVIVTGGARGMGEAHVRRLVKDGARVVFTDVREELGRRLADELGSCVRFVVADVTSAPDWAKTVDAACDAFGDPTGLVNNAGILVTGRVEETSVEDYRRAVEVMQIGPMLGIQAVVPAMRRAGSGSIVNIASTAGVVGYSGILPYTACKWAMRGLTKAAALELASDDIRVNAIHPGDVDTPMNEGHEGSSHVAAADGVPLGRLGQPDDIAALALFLLSDESGYITGADHIIDGGFTIE